MLEAVNSVIANAPFLRQNAEQVSSAALAASEASVASAPQAPYVSPYIFVDNTYDKAVLQIRDSDTGDVLKQFPSTETLAQRARTAEREARAREVSQAQITGQSTNTPQAQQQSASTSVPSNSYAEAQQIAASTSSTPITVTPDVVSAAISAASQSGQPAPSTTQVSA